MRNKYETEQNNMDQVQIIEIIKEISLLDKPSTEEIQRVFRRFPKKNSGFYKKSEVLTVFEKLKPELKVENEQNLRKNLRMKDIRTLSGVVPITVLTKPFPCPGKCIFCPNDVRMPKSYLSDEPGAQRATRNKFDPYAQTYNRLLAYKSIGHSSDKVELIILGGTWTSYPESYQKWFVKRCFDAMNDFSRNSATEIVQTSEKLMPFDENSLSEIDGSKLEYTYNQIISLALIPKKEISQKEDATWEELFNAQQVNQNAETRCIGLVIETRPDEITEYEVIRIRKLGATKVQMGFQSLNDEVLELNKRGHDTQTTRNAVSLLRLAGFKIHAHWMPNLYGSNPDLDITDYEKMFSDPDFKPDEIKVYPCSLISSAELMKYYEKGLWKPYSESELIRVLKSAYMMTPEYCRITRMIRDIGSQDIVVGNKKTNMREIVERELKSEQFIPSEIRSREIRNKSVKLEDLHLKITEYQTSVSNEYFLQYVTHSNEIAGFLRLSLPNKGRFIEELKESAMIREVHVYGQSVQIGLIKKGRPQHLGLGKALIKKAEEISKQNGFNKLAVISSIGTREYYAKLGFKLVDLYQIKDI